MNHPTQSLVVEGKKGEILFTPCPGTKGLDVKETIEQFKDQSVACLITLMPAKELEKYQITGIKQSCQQQGIVSFYLPIEDDQAPQKAFEAAWELCKEQVLNFLDDDQTIAIHCKGGTGRTGLVAALILLERGINLSTVINLIKQIKPKALTPQEQLAYLKYQAASINLNDVL